MRLARFINVVTLTYGNRWPLLEGLLILLESDPVVSKVIVVDNASHYDVGRECKKSLFSKVQVFRNNRNLGSAGGYSKGITIARENEGNLIFLLDDDNYPQPGTTRGIIDTYNDLVRSYNTNKIVVLSFRESQHYPIPIKSPFMDKTNFIGFNPFDFFHRRNNKYIPESGVGFVLKKRGAAYGGMLFSPRLVDDIGLPNSQFVLYFDDFELTKRMLSSGYLIWLDKDHPVDDVQENFSAETFKTPVLGFIFASSDNKIYYLLRNRIYLDCHFDKKNHPLFSFNGFLFLTFITIACVILFKKERLKAILHAYRDGKNGSLGFNERYPI